MKNTLNENQIEILDLILNLIEESMKRSQAIKNLLTSWTHPDLAALYTPDMEVQVNVAQDDGQPIEGDFKGRIWRGWSDGITSWKPFRIPHNSRTTPEANDYDINYDLAAHAEGIGMTGWDWKNQVSRYVAFDFDAITGHSDKHAKKLTDVELKEIVEVVSNIPWVATRRSTSGSGIHLYVTLKPVVHTINHTEHAAVARSVLALMAGLTGFDFQSKVDQCGGNMWVWHRKMKGTSGLTLIKTAEPLTEIPVNWRDHMSVVSNRAKRVVPSFITTQEGVDDIENLFKEVTGQKTKVQLDSEHQKLIKHLHESGARSWWDQDNHCLVTHTTHLKDAHVALGLRGVFETLSKGREKGHDHNCFMYPMRRGAWVVRRFTPRVVEHSIWETDSQGWTRCHYNREPDLETASKLHGGVENKQGAYVFREAAVAAEALQKLNISLALPAWAHGRKTTLKHHKDGRLLVEIEHRDDDDGSSMTDWLVEKKHWIKLFNSSSEDNNRREPDTGNYDDLVRHLVGSENSDGGWVVKNEGQWRNEPLTHVKIFLQSTGLEAKEVTHVLGSCVARPWRIVSRPFEPEILNDREWNRKAPQLAFLPNSNDNLNYPTWTRILTHIGKSLDNVIKEDQWCNQNGIFTGGDYLKCWIASIIKRPSEPLPYLFLFSDEQNTGKSILGEALYLIFTSGVERADNALVNPNAFNGELEGAIVCLVEETDMRSSKLAYNRIKDWTTSPYLPIHKKGETPYLVLNTSHWIQTANTPAACPVLQGDTRITVMRVEPLTKEEMIPKRDLKTLLLREAPDFLGSLLLLELPVNPDRLGLPVINTGDKENIQRTNQSYIDTFIEEYLHEIPGAITQSKDIYELFDSVADPDQRRIYTKHRFYKELAQRFPRGRHNVSNQVIFGNVSLVSGIEPTAKLISLNDKLIPETKSQ